MQEIGLQYFKDDRIDPSGFLKRARLHQSVFRARYLDLPFDRYGNYLTQEDGAIGKNFYDGFGIFDAVKKYRAYNKALYSNLLRSEHIPFNFFIPLDKDRVLCKNVFNDLLKTTIFSIDRIEIEYAPPGPKENYLDDKTSFDAYIEFTSVDHSKGIMGIEVKYTEKEYKLLPKSKQEKNILNKASRYFSVTDACGIYKPQAVEQLKSDQFRQIWRNQLLGESILLYDKDKFKHFISLTLFPSGNTHFVNTSKEYMDLLHVNDHKFVPLTYEDFFAAIANHCPDNRYEKSFDYLRTRYIVSNE